MPIESGPTQLLPFSQKLERGYVSIGQADVRQVFLDNYAQLSLKSGDMIFFNPAVFHAAGGKSVFKYFTVSKFIADIITFWKSYGEN